MVKYMDNKNSGFNQWNAKQNEKKSGLSGFFWWFIIFFASWWLVSLWLAPQPNANQQNIGQEDAEIVALNVPTSTVSNDKMTAQVQGLRISNIDLLDYKQNGKNADKTKPVRLLAGDTNFIEIGFVGNGTSVPVAQSIWQNENGEYSWISPSGAKFTRTINMDGNYVISVVDKIDNTTKQDIRIAPYAKIVQENDKNSSAGVFTGSVVYANSDLEHKDWHKLDKEAFAYSTINGFIGFADQYMETVVDIDSPDQTMRVRGMNGKYQADTIASDISIKAGQTGEIKTNIYAGPRDRRIVNQASNVIEGLDDTLDYGFFWFLTIPMLWILGVLNSFVMNYGLAIILLTILVRVLMLPLTRKSYTSMIAMQKMQPEMARIQKLYANDKARLQMEMLRLYQTHKTSPMSGCLPMLLQIPIFFALYKALLVSVQMRNASFLWISDLAVMDPYFILPILMGLSMWLQQYLQTANTPQTTDKDSPVAQTQKVMKWMPVIFTVMFAWMPAGLVLYWTVSNLIGILQMYILKRMSSKTK